MVALCAYKFRFSPDLRLRTRLRPQDCNNIMLIKIGSRAVMKAKAAIKGTVLEATAKYIWDIKWDDGIARSPYKSQQLKESATDAPPALNTAITKG
jgi:hypothetical protein